MADTPSPPPLHKINLAPFYYGLVVVGATAAVLVLYNLVVIGCCALERWQRLFRMSNNHSAVNYTSQSFESSSTSSSQLASTFKYSTKETEKQLTDIECSVCLSNFQDGEDVRQLPRCKHSFHTACIDMWLYSHSDCPLCRAFVGPLLCHNRVFSEDNSREVLHDPSNSV